MENPEMFRIKVRGTEVQKGAFHKMSIKIKALCYIFFNYSFEAAVQFLVKTILKMTTSGQKWINAEQKSQKTGHKTVCVTL